MIPLITASQLAFWVFGPLAVAGALGMVLSRKPVHSALSLVGMMVCLGCLYASLDAPFLFVAQIVVYTGAIMMLFLFTMMIIGIDTIDSVIETIKGQRLLAAIAAVGLAALLILAVGGGIVNYDPTPANPNGNVGKLAELVFGEYIYAFLATAALLITATLAATVLSHRERLTRVVRQKDLAIFRTRQFAEKGIDPGPKPASGVYARNNAIDYPALLPDGSVAPDSISPTLALRGVAIVENEGLRAPHAAALTEYFAAHDELEGGSKAADVAAALDDSGPQEIDR